MSAPSPIPVIKPVTPTQIGDRIRLTDELEIQLRRIVQEEQEISIRRIVQEELREFMLEQRRAALYINNCVERRLRLTS